MILHLEPEPGDTFDALSFPSIIAGSFVLITTAGVHGHTIGNHWATPGLLRQLADDIDHQRRNHATRSSDTSGGPSETAPD